MGIKTFHSKFKVSTRKWSFIMSPTATRLTKSTRAFSSSKRMSLSFTRFTTNQTSAKFLTNVTPKLITNLSKMDQEDLKLRIYWLRISLKKRSDKRIELGLDPVLGAEVEADLALPQINIKLNKTKKSEIES